MVRAAWVKRRRDLTVVQDATVDEKVSKERMHLDLETDDVEAEVQRLEALGATRYDHQQERGFDFWVYATRGATSSACSRRSSLSCWLGAGLGLPERSQRCCS
jgi:Glyoxalase-like domain